MGEVNITGQCLCSAVKFSISADPIRSRYCHCTKCRKHTGAPVMLGVVFNRKSVKIEGKTVQYYSSPQGCREFFPVCGSSLFFTFSDSPERIEIMAGAFDNGDFIEPTYHLYMSRTLKFFKVDDDLPKYEDSIENEC